MQPDTTFQLQVHTPLPLVLALRQNLVWQVQSWPTTMLVCQSTMTRLSVVMVMNGFLTSYNGNRRYVAVAKLAQQEKQTKRYYQY